MDMITVIDVKSLATSAVLLFRRLISNLRIVYELREGR